MTDDHKKQLEIHRRELKQNMQPPEVIDELRSREVLTPREAEEITRAGGIDAQNAKLLDYLLRKPDSSYGQFCDALRMTGQKHLEQLLRCDFLTVSDYSFLVIKTRIKARTMRNMVYKLILSRLH